MKAFEDVVTYCANTETLPLNNVLCGDCVKELRALPANSIDLAITSPPYFQQRDYAGKGVGNEDKPDDYIESLLTAFAEVLRVVKPTGSIVYNLGDKYQKSSLLLMPYRFALAVSDHFPVLLINNITWVKRNPTPRQYKRRLVSATEPFFHFAKTSDYYYNRKEFHEGKKGQNYSLVADTQPRKTSTKMGESYRDLLASSSLTPEQKKAGLEALDKTIEDVKRGRIHSFRMKIRGIHAPAFGGQEGGRKNQMENNGFTIIRIMGEPMKRDILDSAVESGNGSGHPAVFPTGIVRELVQMLSPPNGVVLDPYAGSGATLVAAKQEGRNFIGIDINAQYCKYANEWSKKV